MIKEAVGTWSFCGHDFTDDELVYAASCMLDHALQMDELDKWRMSAGKKCDLRKCSPLLKKLF